MTPMQDSQRDQIRQTDHDILVELRTQFNLFTKQYSLDIKDLKDGTKLMLDDHEVRLRKVEETVHDDQTSRKAQIRLASVVAAVVSSLLTIAGAILGILSGVIHLR